MAEFTNILLIAGSGRKHGKTLLAEKIIKDISYNHAVVAIKVSPHWHKLTEKQHIVFNKEGLVIAEEKDFTTSKDTARFGRAGASRVWYVQAVDKQLPSLIKWVKKNIADVVPVVCESGALGKYIKPGASIFIVSKQNGKKPEWKFPYYTVTSNQVMNNNLKTKIVWDQNSWMIK